MVTARVQEFLRRSHISYAVYSHDPAYTAADDADVMAVPECDWARVVVCFADGEPIQAVVPANQAVDLARLQALVGARAIRLAREDELDWLFPDCELGVMPPFGPIYRQRVFIDEALASEDRIVFNAGTHDDAIAMHYTDFQSIANPIVGRFGRRM